jgi:hypothetical protein
MNAVWASSDAALNLISQGQDADESMTNAVTQIGEAIQVQQSGAVNSVTVAGSLQSEAGCPDDWQPQCESTFLTDQGDGIWTGTFSLPAGSYEYKMALNADWAENYGAEGARDGGNIACSCAGCRRRCDLHLRPQHTPDHRQREQSSIMSGHMPEIGVCLLLQQGFKAG